MRVWRIARSAYDPLSGEGARRYGGRWNPRGVAVCYTSASLSLAVLELLVHVDPEDVPAGLTAFEIDVPEALLVETVGVEDLPAGWAEETMPAACHAVGRQWVEAASSPVLRVPSAVVPSEANFLLNPGHAEARHIRVVERSPFRFDPRLPGFGGA